MMLQKQPAMTYSINEEPTGKLGLSKILCTRVPGRRLSIYPETP